MALGDISAVTCYRDLMSPSGRETFDSGQGVRRSAEATTWRPDCRRPDAVTRVCVGITLRVGIRPARRPTRRPARQPARQPAHNSYSTTSEPRNATFAAARDRGRGRAAASTRDDAAARSRRVGLSSDRWMAVAGGERCPGPPGRNGCAELYLRRGCASRFGEAGARVSASGRMGSGATGRMIGWRTSSPRTGEPRHGQAERMNVAGLAPLYAST
ncbi:hypothetical protein JHW43_009453 [Diplocarpon mali]|nr:hypothetical protein JHW43_009453 [Diplocarpon mali]